LIFRNIRTLIAPMAMTAATNVPLSSHGLRSVHGLSGGRNNGFGVAAPSVARATEALLGITRAKS
jgi:hypothetical protein